MDVTYNIYFIKDGNSKLIGRRKDEREAFDFVTGYCEDPIKFENIEFSRNVSGFTIRYGVKGEYFSAVKWVV